MPVRNLQLPLREELSPNPVPKMLLHRRNSPRDLRCVQFKELLQQQIPFFQRFSRIPTGVLKLSLEGFEGRYGEHVMEDDRPLSAYPLTEERHPPWLPLAAAVCAAEQRSFVLWRCERREGEWELEKRKARIPQLLNCGHSVCWECWRDGLMAVDEAMAEEKEFLLVDPSLLTEEGVEKQHREAEEKAEEKARRKREREKAENVWKFVCCEKPHGNLLHASRKSPWSLKAARFRKKLWRSFVEFCCERKGQIRCGAFANSLLVIPKTLAEKSGLDVQESIIAVEEEQERSEQPVGLDLNSGQTMLPSAEGVWDSYIVKKQTLNLATVLATQLLLVDEVMKAGKAMGGQPSGGPTEEE